MLKPNQRKTWFGLFARALFPRLLFLIHGMMCVYLLVQQEQNNLYWYFTICLGLLFLEGIFNVIVRHGKEFHWFCPSAFLYCVVLVVTLVVLREKQIQCLKDNSYCTRKLSGSDLIMHMFNSWTYEKRADMLEQTGLLVLIIGRWLLPQGSISKEQFCQILLIYIGTAADIVEFSEIYKDDDIIKLSKDTEDVLHGCMAVWGLSVVQFSLTIALPEEGLKEEEEEEEDNEDQVFERMSYFRAAKQQNKVAPMTYMQYKSLMREGLNNDSSETNGGVLLTARGRNVRPGAKFQEKYPTLGGFDNNTSLRSKPAGLEPIADSPRVLRTDATNLFSLSNQSNGSITQRSDASGNTTTRSKKINLPHGGRLPQNIGSPPPSSKAFGSPITAKSKKTSITKRPFTSNSTVGSPMSARSKKSSISQRPITRERRSPKESVVSMPDNSNTLSVDTTTQPITSWDRLLERIPWLKKRARHDEGNNSERKDSTKEDNSLGIGKQEVKGCFYQYLDLIAIMLPVCMQDGPFFILRLVLVAHYGIMTDLIIILMTKNALVIIVNIYRILIIYCSEPPKDTADMMEDPSLRVRAAMNTNQKLSDRSSFRTKRASIAVQALSRMQLRLFGKEDDSVLKQTRQNEIEIGEGVP